MLAYSPATFTAAPHFAGLASQFDPSPYSRQSRLQELRRVEAAIQAEIAEEEARRRHLAQRAALEFALRQQAEERRRRQEAEAEARMIAAAIARRQERAREIALARYAQEQEYRRRVEYARQQQHNAQLRQQLEARRQRARQAQIAPALVQLVVDIFAAQQEEDKAAQRNEEPASTAPVKAEKHVEFALDTRPPVVAKPADAEKVAGETSPGAIGPELEDAAKVLQRRFRRHAARRSALEQLSALAKDLVTRRREFEAPAELHFQSSPAASDLTLTPSSAPLAYDKSNKSFLGYEDFLVSLLSKIDAVESNGDKVVQRARKGLVAQVEKELSRLDELKQHEWERQSGTSSAASATASDSEDGVEEEEHVASALETADVVAQDLDETAVPSSVLSDIPTPANDVATVPADDSTVDTESAGHASPEQTEPVIAERAAAATVAAETDSTPTSKDIASASATTELPTPRAAEPSEPTHGPTSTTELSVPHDDEADSTASSSDDEIDAVVAQVLNRAKALGEQVEALERADRTDTSSTPENASSIRDDESGEEIKNKSPQDEVAPAEAAAPATVVATPESETASRPTDAKAVAAEADDSTKEEKIADVREEDSKSEAATEDFEML
ncbi:hypothetical protein BMF94_2086 [Rhodotorula taiwanensis]|uniref:BAG domain-containing protein n=1 Tax=Rhodotorula taiwanensis TaxID=741276 RepID=A0A2S5BDI5_9BASI|nr:hypothetical protein BMF94_2086 [Rhodotorula taiwanensis]